MVTGTGDQMLWQQFKKGDRQSLSSIYQSHFEALFEYGLRLSHNREAVKDCIQELFIKLWSNRNNLGDIQNLRSYLLVSLRGTVYNWLKKNDRLQLFGTGEDLGFEMKLSSLPALQESEDELQRKKLLIALEQLTPRQREMIYLRFFEELDYEEIAAIMQITTKGAYKLSGRALDVLRQSMNVHLIHVLFSLHLLKRQLFG